MIRGIECAAWGVVAHDPELKTGKSGTPYCSVNVGQDAETGKDIVQWCRVTAFKETALQTARTLIKGSHYFEGSLTLNRWHTSDGQERTDFNVTAWKLERVGATGKNRPPRHGAANYQAPIEQSRQAQQKLDDSHPPSKG